jgi:hypothetical protein
VSKVPALCDSALTPIGICPQKFRRKLAAACLLAGVLAFAGCGGDDDSAPAPSKTAEATETAATETMPTEAETDTEAQPAETAPELKTETSPEDAGGGAGDEEPARTLALFTARNGQIRPRLVRVPAFISVQIELRSADGAEYGLKFGDVTIRAGGQIDSTSTTIDGLRPNESIAGEPQGAGNRVRISATAEPGP